MKKTLLAAALLAATLSAQADVKLWGQSTYQINDIDLGDDSAFRDDLNFSENGFSASRLGVDATAPAWNGIVFGAAITFDLDSSVTKTAGNDSDGGVAVRQDQVYAKGAFGKVSLGHGDDVGDGTINADLAGTNLSDALSSNTATNGVGANGFDPNRGDALRYYSPKLGKIATIAVQLQEAGGSEIALKADFMGFRFNAFVEDNGSEDYNPQTNDYDDAQGFLIGYKAPFGLSVTYVQSEKDQTDDTTDEHSGWKVGYAFGKHRISYSQVTLEEEGAEDADATGLAYEFTPTKGVDLFIVQKTWEKDGFEDRDGLSLGARVKF